MALISAIASLEEERERQSSDLYPKSGMYSYSFSTKGNPKYYFFYFALLCLRQDVLMYPRLGLKL